jgi:serine/threonine-protein kinase RsbW
MHTRLSLPAEFSALEALDSFVRELVEIPHPAACERLVLALHELCINIVQHAYAGEEGRIIIDAEFSGARLTFRVQDFAHNAYINANKPAPDPSDLPESGWGMIILHKVMRSVEYQRLREGNLWLLQVDLPLTQ